MPTYEYRCQRCGHTFEAFHGVSAVFPSCPACVAHSPVRIISAGLPPVFKGHGFYATDYRSSCQTPERVEPPVAETKTIERM